MRGWDQGTGDPWGEAQQRREFRVPREWLDLPIDAARIVQARAEELQRAGAMVPQSWETAMREHHERAQLAAAVVEALRALQPRRAPSRLLQRRGRR